MTTSLIQEFRKLVNAPLVSYNRNLHTSLIGVNLIIHWMSNPINRYNANITSEDAVLDEFKNLRLSFSQLIDLVLHNKLPNVTIMLTTLYDMRDDIANKHDHTIQLSKVSCLTLKYLDVILEVATDIIKLYSDVRLGNHYVLQNLHHIQLDILHIQHTLGILYQEY